MTESLDIWKQTLAKLNSGLDLETHEIQAVMRQILQGSADTEDVKSFLLALKAKGETIDPDKELQLLAEIKARYDAQISPYYAASRLWIDAIIDPRETRKVISMGIEMAAHQGTIAPYQVGVIQT
mgnify:CR=1 FL=1